MICPCGRAGLKAILLSYARPRSGAPGHGTVRRLFEFLSVGPFCHVPLMELFLYFASWCIVGKILDIFIATRRRDWDQLVSKLLFDSYLSSLRKSATAQVLFCQTFDSI